MTRDLSPQLPLTPAWQELNDYGSNANFINTVQLKQILERHNTQVQLEEKTTHSSKEPKKRLLNVINATKLGKKERALLVLLSKKFQPKTKMEISEATKSKAPIKLISEVKKKLHGSGFDIKTNKRNYRRDTTYEIHYLPIKK